MTQCHQHGKIRNFNKIINNLDLYKFIISCISSLPGDYCERVIPDPIPNSEVKPFSADGTLS